MEPEAAVSARERLSRAKLAFTTRRVVWNQVSTILTDGVKPKSGDLLLARVERLGQHVRVELPNGRRARLFVGDEIAVAYGNRYAPDQFEAVVPKDLGPCHLVAAGGVAARVLTRHHKMKKATRLSPVGLLGDQNGKPLNLQRFALRELSIVGSRPVTIAVVGTAMNSGKTTTAAHLIQGLVSAGLRVGATKVTGTGAGGDLWLMGDAGANPVLDFVDAGFPSTYRVSSAQVVGIVNTLVSHLRRAGVEAIVMEIADGLFQEETAELLNCPDFREIIDRVLFTACDALGASAGVRWLREHGLPPLAISGALTLSPLAMREAQEATGVPVLSTKRLRDPSMYELVKDSVKGRLEIQVDPLNRGAAAAPA